MRWNPRVWASRLSETEEAERVDPLDSSPPRSRPRCARPGGKAGTRARTRAGLRGGRRPSPARPTAPPRRGRHGRTSYSARAASGSERSQKQRPRTIRYRAASRGSPRALERGDPLAQEALRGAGFPFSARSWPIRRRPAWRIELVVAPGKRAQRRRLAERGRAFGLVGAFCAAHRDGLLEPDTQSRVIRDVDGPAGLVGRKRRQRVDRLAAAAWIASSVRACRHR